MLATDNSINATAIRHLLFEKGKMSLDELTKVTEYKEEAIRKALGKLYNDNRIDISDLNGAIYVELKDACSDIYY